MNIDRILSNIIQRDKTRNIAHNTNFFPKFNEPKFSFFNHQIVKNRIKPNPLMAQRINKLPVYAYIGKPTDINFGEYLSVKVKDRPDITTEAQMDADKALIDEKNGKYFEVKASLTNNKNLLPITSPTFKSKSAGRLFYQMVKRHPNLLSDIEQSGTNVVMVPYGYKQNINKKSKTDFGGFFLKPHPPHRPQSIIEIFTKSMDSTMRPSQTLFHELRHSRQYVENPKLYNESEGGYEKYHEIEKDPELSEREMAGYAKIPAEEDAERYAIDKYRQIKSLYGTPAMEALKDIEYKHKTGDINEYRDYLIAQGNVLPTEKEIADIELQRQGTAMRYIFDSEKK